jgi:hypothetical protein
MLQSHFHEELPRQFQGLLRTDYQSEA